MSKDLLCHHLTWGSWERSTWKPRAWVCWGSFCHLQGTVCWQRKSIPTRAAEQGTENAAKSSTTKIQSQVCPCLCRKEQSPISLSQVKPGLAPAGQRHFCPVCASYLLANIWQNVTQKGKNGSLIIVLLLFHSGVLLKGKGIESS